MSELALDLQFSGDRGSGNGDGKKVTRKTKINVPAALPTLLEQIAKTILIHQPDDVFLFARDYLDAVIAGRSGTQADQDFSSPQQSPPDKYGWQGKSVGDGFGVNKTEEIASPMIRSVGVMGDKVGIKDTKMSASLRGKGDSLDSGLSRSNDFYGTRSGEEIYIPGQAVHDKSPIYHSSSPFLENKADEESVQPKSAGITDAYPQEKISEKLFNNEISAIPSSPSKIQQESPSDNLKSDLNQRKAMRGSQLGPRLFEDEYDHIPFQDNYNSTIESRDVKMIEGSAYALRRKSSTEISSESSENYVPEEDEIVPKEEILLAREYTCGPISEEEEDFKLTHAQALGQGKNEDQKFIPGLIAATTTLAHSLFPKRTSAVIPLNGNEAIQGGEVTNDRTPLMDSSYPSAMKETQEDRGSFEISGYTREETSSLARSSASSPSSSVIDDKETVLATDHIVESPCMDKSKINGSRSDDILDYGFTKEEDEEQDKHSLPQEISKKEIQEVDDASAAEEKEPQRLKYEKLIESPLTDGDVKAIHEMFSSYKPLDLVKDREDHYDRKRVGVNPSDKAHGFDNHGFKHSQEIDASLQPNKASPDKDENSTDNMTTNFDEEENAAALLIQAMYKGYKVRKELFADETNVGKISPEHKRRHTEGYAKVNSPQLGQVSSDEYFRPFDGDLINKAAAKIQAGIKGYLTRKDMKDFLTTLPPNDHRFDTLKKDLLKESPMGRSDSVDAQLDETSIWEPLDDEETMSQSLSNSPLSHQSLISASAKLPTVMQNDTTKPSNTSEKFFDVQNETIALPEATVKPTPKDSELEPDFTNVSQSDKIEANNIFDYPDFLDSAATVIQSAFKSFIHTKKKASTGESDTVSPVNVSPNQANNRQELVKDVAHTRSLSDEEAEDSDTGTIKSMSRPSMEEETSVNKQEHLPNSSKKDKDNGDQSGVTNTIDQTSENSDVSYVYRNLNPLLTFRTDDGVLMYNSNVNSTPNLIDLSHTPADKDHHPFLN